MQKKSLSTSRKCNGNQMVEGTAALALVLPAFLVMIAVIVECSSFLLVKNGLDEAARTAARNCALAYHWPPYGVAQAPVGTLYSPSAQGDTVAPASTSAVTPVASPPVVGTDPGAVSSSGQPMTANDAFSRVRIANIISSNAQFSAVYIPAAVNDTAAPQYQTGHVVVTATSINGIFPLPDPLNLQKLIPNFKIQASSTYSL